MNLNSLDKIGVIFRRGLLVIGLGMLVEPILQAQPIGVIPSPVGPAASNQPAETPDAMLQDAYHAFTGGNPDAAMQIVNKVITDNSQNVGAHLLRGAIYAQKQKWSEADYDYQTVLTMQPENVNAKFNLAELKFLQKKYDDARVGFADLANDKDMGDYSSYKVLLCDLLAGHTAAADQDLKALSQVDGTPSYYFGNAAWDIARNKTDDAASWLKSAAYIYQNAPEKFSKYAASLTSIGYLPLRMSSTQ